MFVPNSSFDFFLSPHVPPGDAPDLEGVPCNLQGDFEKGGEPEAALRWTHQITCADDVAIRDSFPGTPVHRVYIPTKDHTRFDVVFVERLYRGQPGAFKRVYLDRKEVHWPTMEL